MDLDCCDESIVEQQHPFEINSDEPPLDFLLSTSASRVVAIAGISAPCDITSANVGVFDDDVGPFSKLKTSSLSSVANMLSRRSHISFPVSCSEHDTSIPTLRDVRKVVFQTTSRCEKRIVSGLKAHTFTSQAFISSFAVGLAIGSILAIIVKIISEVGYRLFPFGEIA